MGIFSKNGIIKSDGVARSIRQSGLEERAAAVKSRKEKKVSRLRPEVSQDSAAEGSFFAPQVLQSAYVRLKTRLTEVGAKFDPEMYVAGVTIALAYVQRESGFFLDFAVFMLACFGDSIKPHLLSFYAGVCNVPDVADSGLTSYEECLREHEMLMQAGV